MGLGSKRGMMWAGVMDGQIATDDGKSIDDYTPITVALFTSKAEAQKRYQKVVRVDADALLRIDEITASD
jgi:hypothetical protein